MVLACARAGIPPSDLDAMPGHLAGAIVDLLGAQAEAMRRDSDRG